MFLLYLEEFKIILFTYLLYISSSQKPQSSLHISVHFSSTFSLLILVLIQFETVIYSRFEWYVKPKSQDCRSSTLKQSFSLVISCRIINLSFHQRVISSTCHINLPYHQSSKAKFQIILLIVTG